MNRANALLVLGLVLLATVVAALLLSPAKKSDVQTPVSDAEESLVMQVAPPVGEIVQAPHVLVDEADFESQTSADVDLRMEARMVSENSIDISAFQQIVDFGVPFDLLTKELRNSSGPRSISASTRFRNLFLQKEGVMKGSVVVESLECGVYLCAVEFRALNEEQLNLYANDVLTDPKFDGGVLYQPYLDSQGQPDKYRQYVFSHDPEIKKMNFADGSSFKLLSREEAERLERSLQGQ